MLLDACQSGTTAPVEVTLDASGESCRIAILDRGTGISASDVGRVFEPFYTTKKTGTGLGLAIVRRFTELQNGTIVLEPHRAAVPSPGSRCR